MSDTPDRPRYRASRAFAVLAAAFALLFGGVAALLAVNQQHVLTTAERLQRETVPEIVRYQRLTRNLDHLRHEGERVFSADSPASRQQALFVVMLVASHPSIVEHPAAADVARDVEAFLVETGRQAAASPASLNRRQPEWQRLSLRIGLLIDDLSAHGAGLATRDLTEMSAAMNLARYKLAGALVLVGGFLVLMIVLLRQHLIHPLQRIDAALSSLAADRPAPTFPPARLTEIHAVEEAALRLHAAQKGNEAARRELERLANSDGLTGLINRRHFLLRAAAELRRAERYERPTAVALGDLDHFKRLNDTYGRGTGDIVLRTVADLLGEGMRQSDLVCRYGGEEFAFLFPECTVDQAHVLLERFRHSLAGHDIPLPDGAFIRVTISIGVADASHGPIETALHHADFALYEAKRLGRNRVIVAERESRRAT